MLSYCSSSVSIDGIKSLIISKSFVFDLFFLWSLLFVWQTSHEISGLLFSACIDSKDCNSISDVPWHLWISWYTPYRLTPLGFWLLYNMTILSMKYWLAYLKILAGTTFCAKWIPNIRFVIPFVRILVVTWQIMRKSVVNIVDIDDDSIRQCNSRQGFGLYSTKAMFSCHKYTDSSFPRVGPTIWSSTSNISRSLDWDCFWNNYSFHNKG